MDTENKKIVRVVLAVACLLLGYLLNRGLIYLSNVANIPNASVLDLFPVSVLISVVVSVATFAWTATNTTVTTFLLEVFGELKKVVWPTRKETALSTMVVIVLVFITAVVIWVLDWVWAALIRAMIS